MSLEDSNFKNHRYVIKNIDHLLVFTDSISKWGIDRNITAEGGATALSQSKKLLEECQEFIDAVTHEEAKDAIGDIFVVLVQLCRLRGYHLDECVRGAWNEIKHRKGKMENGLFIKDAS